MKLIETAPALRYHPERDGLERWLGSLEASIMVQIWEMGGHLIPVKRVHRELRAEREIAHTTVMTTMNRLVDKGILTRQRIDPRDMSYYYTARHVDESEFLDEQLRAVVQSLELSDSELLAYNRACNRSRAA